VLEILKHDKIVLRTPNSGRELVPPIAPVAYARATLYVTWHSLSLVNARSQTPHGTHCLKICAPW